jgi:predicted NAD/FAD-dependent oxidoreductase
MLRIALQLLTQLTRCVCVVRTQVPFDGAAVFGSAGVAFLSRQSSKPGRGVAADGQQQEAWVAVSTPAFAAAALARQRAATAGGALPPQPPAQDVAAALWEATAEAFAASAGVPAASLPRPVSLLAQRWGGATPSAPLGAPCLGDAGACFAACGDWAAGGGGVSAAVRSGAAAATLVADALLLA